MILANDGAPTETSPSSSPAQPPTPPRHLLYRTSRTQFPTSRSIQSAPDTTIKPSSPVPSSPLSEATSGNDGSELSDTAHSTKSTHEPEPTLFHPLKRLPHYPTYDLRPIGFAYQPERWYPDAEFRALWNSPAVDISDHLIPRELSVAPYDDAPSVVHTEGEFDGIPIRLKLDPLKSADLEPFQRGTVVSYKESNSEVGKYMVECCQLVRENVAYLKVVYRTTSQAVFSAYDEKRPAFILSIPACLNAAPSPPFPPTSNDSTSRQQCSTYPHHSDNTRNHTVCSSLRARCRRFLSLFLPCIDI